MEAPPKMNTVYSNILSLKACVNLASVEEWKYVNGKPVKMTSLQRGMSIHTQIATSCSDLDVKVASTLVRMYAKCGCMLDAQRVFDGIQQQDLVLWNVLILGYAENGEGDIALEKFFSMPCPRDAQNFLAAVKACACLGSKEENKNSPVMKRGPLERGMSLHFQLVQELFAENLYLQNTLIGMYAACGSMVDARKVFDQMSLRTIVSWNALLLGYAENGEGEVALEMFARAPIVDTRTFSAALTACISLSTKEEGLQIDGKLVKVKSLERGAAIHCRACDLGFDTNVYVASTLVDFYSKCGCMVKAKTVFDNMDYLNVVSWTALVLGYADNGDGELALEVFARMSLPGGCKPNALTFVASLKACICLAEKAQADLIDGELVKREPLLKGIAIHSQAAARSFDSHVYVAATLVDMYAKCGSMVRARSVFEKCQGRNMVAYNALLLGYVENGDGESALDLYKNNRFGADDRTFVSALKACGMLVDLETGKEIHSEVIRRGLQNEAFVASALVDFYGKCGNVEDAQHLFDSLQTKDSVSWTALIAAYSRQGDAERVFHLFEQDSGFKPNKVTLLCVLTACNHAGLVDKGMNYLDEMKSRYGINPEIEHYHCIIDVLGRANELEKAVAVVESMPFEPTVVTWNTVLSSCKKWKNATVGKLAFDSLVRLDANHATAYVLMSHV